MSSARSGSENNGIRRLLDVVARLRGEDGCPWDREQTVESLKPYLIEEAYELLEAIDSGDTADHLDELGDVLLQVVLQARIREEEGAFCFDDIADKLAEKLIRRHPHVFGDVKVSGSDEVIKRWEAIKSEERGDDDAFTLDGVPIHLPALQRAQRVQSRASRVGFDWATALDASAKLEEELRELREALEAGEGPGLEEEIGDLLFTIVNLCRFRKVNAEEALRKSVNKFTRRFREVEARLHDQGKRPSDSSLEEMDRLWDQVKREERL